MQNRKEYLKQLLHQKEWKQEDRDWLLQYLNENDLTDLQEVAAEAYDADLLNTDPVLEREHSERILEKIHQRISARRQPEPVVRRISFSRWKVAVAAIIILIAGAGILGLLRKPVKQLSVTSGTQRKTVTLPDGSVAYLEPGTTLKYTGNYGRKERNVTLTGEALFKVQKDDKLPFIVASSLISTKVLGTSFNMEAKNVTEARVVVLTGMVQVEAKGEEDQKDKEVILTANKRAVYNSNTHLLEMSDATDDARFYSQKQQGRFIYDGEEIIKVVNDLERYYNIEIKVDGRIQHCAFYGDVNIVDDLEKALDLIAVSLNAKINKDKNGNGYVIAGGNCH
ncbi:FecR domain-containing protein [Chitinophaga filiformis]|uniref:FecR family protein n=1 Tax=Chitinophaga filiformis TaxID=104663 RepID=UPI001F1DAA33|nr:FecR domain-containing protein [Chitinophaga filiformis]MCF6402613.1 FecR domain-containing protein [Chitinophaga filiformis]MCF6403469.1 FecR domain-containing protein [Chitinophaga filiformis]